MRTLIPEWTTADRLRKAREAACLDQEQLADRMGVSRNTVTNYERGRTTHHRVIVLRAWSDEDARRAVRAISSPTGQRALF